MRLSKEGHDPREAPMPRGGPKRITQAEIDEIVAACLDRVPYYKTAERLGCSKNTVMDHWHKWLDQSSEERREQLERKRTEVIERLDSSAAKARKGAVRARLLDDESEAAKAEARYLAEERQALIGLARVAGYDAPISISGRVEMSDEQAREALAKLPKRSRQRLGLV